MAEYIQTDVLAIAFERLVLKLRDRREWSELFYFFELSCKNKVFAYGFRI